MTPAPSPAAIGDPVESADYAFSYATLEPRPDAPQALLVLLHGVGADETQLAALGARAPAGTLVALPRGYRSISGGRTGWYRVGISDDGLQVVEDEEAEARSRLVDFVAQLQSHFDVPPALTWVGGFSQGGILAASAALTSPGCVAGFVMIAGRLLPDLEPVDVDAVRSLDALIVHGRDDDTLALDDARDAASQLEALGIATSFVVQDGGHELTDAMVDSAVQWLDVHLQRA
ncbi:phospholipase/carboxylesterase [Lysobacter sp. PAGU 2638]